ncbi:Blue light- and temperature-regulated antirepressor YcgF [Variovorax sp. SRS16]|uniref:BLUF domain-containing protein n=1 Tax=Variovorax sp. SRS16 TaxID=282217 RepID=UPI00131904EB|nr:BLUF domain-containing protein [Variovorax sp. SRS16]VTU14211.1 Blue light- and temperature-regulated antirepressor YcgF [Variovorax sp. SRS16]
MAELHEILYCSMLAPDQSVTVVGQIVTAARARNLQDQITGLLVFDGQRFCQHFEGPCGEVLLLMERLQADPRHTQLRVVYEGSLTKRRYERFEMGLAEVETIGDDMGGIHELEGVEALERFLALRSGLDISS